MLTRQRTILRVLADAGPDLDKLGLYKLLFLLAEEHSELPRQGRHEFVPYHRGPYSFTLAYDLQSLERDGAVTEGETSITIHPLGMSQGAGLTGPLADAVDRVLLRHGAKSTTELIDYVYSSYPWYTLNSKWTGRRAVTRPHAPVKVYTTGYESVSLDGLLNRLLKAGIQRLIDVRANPVARRFGFHKSTLARICPKVGIEYLHLPEVGVPSEWRTELTTISAYKALFTRYEQEILPKHETILCELQLLIKQKPSALMCKESAPDCCHRTTLAKVIAKRTGLSVRDLGEEAGGGLF